MKYILIILAFSFLQVDETFTVTDSGPISGTLKDGIRIYKGIPFSAPPLGNLRWKAPQPVKKWEGVKECTAFGPSPVQDKPARFSMWTEEYLIPASPISEDCLYLNVWTGAKKADDKRAVIVWIYGGGFGSGGSGVPIYDGEAMAKKGIVFVSVNYRVGVFGFFAHPDLTKESGYNASGNYGLLDQIAALKWVQKNIAAFGGDPKNVTIAGQSAGAMSVNCLVASPLGKGLFQRAIGESGSSVVAGNYIGKGLSQAEEDGIQTAKKLSISSLADLRKIPAAELLTKARGQRGPIVDGYVLPETVAKIFAEGKQNKVSLLTGSNQDEGLTFGLMNYAWANEQLKQSKDVYVYRFTRKVPATGEYVKYGAFHTGEVPYAYDNLKFVDRPWEKADQNLATIMSSYWVNFAKTGNPNGKGLPQWPAYQMKDQKVMVFDVQSIAKEIPDRSALDSMYRQLQH